MDPSRLKSNCPRKAVNDKCQSAHFKFRHLTIWHLDFDIGHYA
jgi:hypothetical protein